MVAARSWDAGRRGVRFEIHSMSSSFLLCLGGGFPHAGRGDREGGRDGQHRHRRDAVGAGRGVGDERAARGRRAGEAGRPPTPDMFPPDRPIRRKGVDSFARRGARGAGGGWASVPPHQPRGGGGEESGAAWRGAEGRGGRACSLDTEWCGWRGARARRMSRGRAGVRLPAGRGSAKSAPWRLPIGADIVWRRASPRS